MPAMPELYMHRIGRTGRADKLEQQLVLLHQERKKQKWNWSLNEYGTKIVSPTEVEVSPS
jgi:superfamily II DNA/RNA helicase